MSAAAWESLHKATLELAKPTALKQRLTDAYESGGLFGFRF